MQPTFSREKHWVFLGACLIALSAAEVSCHAGPTTERQQKEAVGTIALPLEATAPSGVTYRLDGQFSITGASVLTISSADHAGASIVQELRVGEYLIRLEPGWTLVRITDGGFVPAANATLVSANPQSFTILEGETASVVFKFEVDGEVVFAKGTLELSIAIDETDAGAAGGTDGTGGAGGTGGLGGAGGTGGSGATGGIPALRHEVVWEFPPNTVPAVNYVETVLTLRNDPNTMLIATQSNGCAEGSIWRATLDPVTKLPTSVVHVQRLSQGPTVRMMLFESPVDGTLLTGGGWCGGQPAYYSVDHGATWASAVSGGGVHPSDSVFVYTAFNGSVYAGAGLVGEVYRWKGNATWDRVYSTGTQRNLIAALAAYDGKLYVGGSLYEADCSRCSGIPAVVSSADGQTFTATSGIPGCRHVYELFTINGAFYALTQDCSGGQRDIYAWNASSATWSWYADGAPGNSSDGQRLAQAKGMLFGRAGDLKTIWVSADVGRTWQTIPAPTPENGEIPTILSIDNIVYWTAYHGTDGVARIYRIVL